MNERIIYKGQLAEAELRTRELATKAEGLRASLRLQLLPTTPLERLTPEIIAAQAVDLAAILTELAGTRTEVAKIRDLLGN